MYIVGQSQSSAGVSKLLLGELGHTHYFPTFMRVTVVPSLLSSRFIPTRLEEERRRLVIKDTHFIPITLGSRDSLQSFRITAKSFHNSYCSRLKTRTGVSFQQSQSRGVICPSRTPVFLRNFLGHSYLSMRTHSQEWKMVRMTSQGDHSPHIWRGKQLPT